MKQIIAYLLWGVVIPVSAWHYFKADMINNAPADSGFCVSVLLWCAAWIGSFLFVCAADNEAMEGKQ